MNYLSYVTYSCIVVTHVASRQCRKGRTSQSCTHITATVRSTAGCSRQDGWRLLYLPPPGLSVSSTSESAETGCPGHRRQDCVHGEAIHEARRTPAFIWQCEGLVAERHGESGVGGVPSAEGKAWVSDLEVGATRWSWNIGLTVC